MAEKIEIYSDDPNAGGAPIDTLDAGPVPLTFSSGLKYTKHHTEFPVKWIVANIESAADPDELQLQIVDGRLWHLERDAKYLITNPDTGGGLRWVYNVNGSMTVTAWYPTSDGSIVEWEMIDPDDPPAKLTVVVKRIP